MRSLKLIALMLCLPLFLSGCGYNAIQRADEDSKAKWSRCSTSTSDAPTWCPTSWLR